LPAVAGSPLLISWFPFFISGIAMFRWRQGMASNAECVAVNLLAGTAATLSGPWQGVFAGLAASLFIALYERPLPAAINWYAGITYSLYLVHWPIGKTAMKVLHKLGDSCLLNVFVLLAGVLVSFISATIFWRFIELPAVKLAAKVTGRRAPEV
jgi:peptidoglycan/LPS O-acetylase OafA/YrhL